MITEAKVKKIVDQAITAAVPQIIEAMQPAQQAPAIQVQDNPTIVYTDDYLKTCLDAKAEIMKGVALTGKCDIVYARSNRGTTEVNQTKDALNLIDDQIAEWRDRKTHRKV